MDRRYSGCDPEVMGFKLQPVLSSGCGIPSSLAVVENLRGKCKGEFVLSFSESVHPIVPQKKKSPLIGLGEFFSQHFEFSTKIGLENPLN